MATEVFANTPSGIVTSGGTDAPASGTVETWTLASYSSFPAAATGTTQFHITDIGAPAELILVTNTSGATWTVTRGAESTTPVAHTLPFTVVQVTSAGWLGGLAQLASPAFTGAPSAPTAPALTDSTQIATTAYADSAVAAEKTRAEAAEATLVPLSDLPLSIGNGGTGQTAAAAAYNALSPMTTKGDIEYDSSGGTAARLAVGSAGQILGVSGGVPAWLSSTVYSSQTLGSAAASITFSSIPGTYNLLRLLVFGASANATESDRWSVTVNGSSADNYDLQQVAGSNTTAAAAVRGALSSWLTGYGISPGDMPGASATSGVAGTLEIQVPGYAGTAFQKTGLWRSGYSDAATSASDQSAVNAVIAWRSAAAITSITVSAFSGSNLVTGTTAYLYLS